MFLKKFLKTFKTQFLFTFLLITIALLITVTIYFCSTKYQPKQDHLLPFIAIYFMMQN